ncbi:MAG: hypothetical protein EOM87_02915 [Clostridia bacterium]|nr:hypothetical protein [Clostridia bacterium]
MKIWKITAPNTFVMEDIQLSSNENSVKVKITKAAISSSDLAIFLGKAEVNYPIVPCRIAAGLVSEAPAGSGLKKGERVLLSPYISPEGKNTNDIKYMGMHSNGYLSNYAIVPIENVFQLPEGINDEQAVFAEYIAMGNNAITQLEIESQEYLAIVGANPLGLMLGQLASYYHIIPIIIDKNEDKLALAGSFGISYCINSEKQDPQQKVLEITGGKMADCTIFEGRSGQLPQLAFNLTAQGGRVGIIGYNNSINKLNADIRTILYRQLKVIGINNGYKDFRAAINLLANEVVTIDGIVSGTGEFDTVPEFFKKAVEEGDKNLKLLINC